MAKIPAVRRWAMNFTGYDSLMRVISTVKSGELNLTYGGKIPVLPGAGKARAGDWVVGTVCGHAIFVEQGTSKMKAQPFLRPAAKKALRELENMDADNTQELIRKIAKKIAKYAKEMAPHDTGELEYSIVAAPAFRWEQAKRQALADARRRAGTS